jgi:putative ABC transport system ATP-binding protein
MLTINNLKAGYGDKTVVDLKSFTIEKGKKCLIRGTSGSGKTTLLYAIAGLGDIHGGTVSVAGTDVYKLSEGERDRFRGEKLGIVFQTLHLVKSLTVLENILLGSFVNKREQNVAWAKELLARLGIAELADRPASEISQGQAQRVAIARALLNKPALLLADEPTSSLDTKSALQVIALLKSLSAETGATLLVSSHDDRIRNEFDQTLEMGVAA